jgi:hypothetical protein
VIKPDEPVPSGSRFKGYREFTVQGLDISPHNTRYRLEHWLTPDNKTLTGQLPSELSQRHFGPQLVSYILYQYHHCQTTQPLLLEQLRESFHAEKDSLLQAGLKASSGITVDDSGARHQGKTGYVTHIGNDFFAWFESTASKSRINCYCYQEPGTW